MRAPTRVVLAGWIVAMVFGRATAFAGCFRLDFNSDGGVLNSCGTWWDGATTTRTGGTSLLQDGGVPRGATAGGPQEGVAGDGFLQLTFAAVPGSSPVVFTSFLCGGLLFDDFDYGLVISGFTFECDVRIAMIAKFGWLLGDHAVSFRSIG